MWLWKEEIGLAIAFASYYLAIHFSGSKMLCKAKTSSKEEEVGEEALTSSNISENDRQLQDGDGISKSAPFFEEKEFIPSGAAERLKERLTCKWRREEGNKIIQLSWLMMIR